MAHVKWLLMVAILWSLGAAVPAFAAESEDPQALVDKATRTVANFAVDPDIPWLRDNAHRAEAFLVVPTMIKGGIVFLGGSGGKGVLVSRDRDRDAWSYPAFYSMGAVSFGLQLGGEVAEVVLMVMTRKGLDALLSTEVKLGVDTSIAAGPIGAGVKAQSADVLAFSRTKGLYGGISFEGAVIQPRNSWNAAYYGTEVSPSDVLILRKAANPGADALRAKLKEIAAKSGS